jgi:hypothetical protein
MILAMLSRGSAVRTKKKHALVVDVGVLSALQRGAFCCCVVSTPWLKHRDNHQYICWPLLFFFFWWREEGGLAAAAAAVVCVRVCASATPPPNTPTPSPFPPLKKKKKKESENGNTFLGSCNGVFFCVF